MKFTIINKAGQYLHTEAFLGLKLHLKWLNESECNILNGDKYIDERICFDMDLYTKEKSDPEIINLLIAIEEELETGNFFVVPHPNYYQKVIVTKDGVLQLMDVDRTYGRQTEAVEILAIIDSRQPSTH